MPDALDNPIAITSVVYIFHQKCPTSYNIDVLDVPSSFVLMGKATSKANMENESYDSSDGTLSLSEVRIANPMSLP